MNPVNRQQPPWRRVFDRVERKIGEPLEGVATSERFVDVMATGMKAKRAVTGSAGWLVGGVLRKVLHAANIATLSDVKRLNGHLSELASEMRAIPQPRALPRPDTAVAPKRPAKTNAKKATAKKSSPAPAKKAAAKKTATKSSQAPAKRAPVKNAGVHAKAPAKRTAKRPPKKSAAPRAESRATPSTETSEVERDG